MPNPERQTRNTFQSLRVGVGTGIVAAFIGGAVGCSAEALLRPLAEATGILPTRTSDVRPITTVIATSTRDRGTAAPGATATGTRTSPTAMSTQGTPTPEPSRTAGIETSTPTRTPGPSATPGPDTDPVSAREIDNRKLGPNEKYTSVAYSFYTGDLVADGLPSLDGKAKTGRSFYTNAAIGIVEGSYGGEVHVLDKKPTIEQRNRYIQRQLNEGCLGKTAGGCDEVHYFEIQTGIVSDVNVKKGDIFDPSKMKVIPTPTRKP